MEFAGFVESIDPDGRSAQGAQPIQPNGVDCGSRSLVWLRHDAPQPSSQLIRQALKSITISYSGAANQ